MTLLTPALRLQLAATAIRHVDKSQPPLSCSTSPCYCKPTFQAITFQGSTWPIRIGHVDNIDATPLLDWLPYCQWDGKWQHYPSGHHSTHFTVPHADIDHTLHTLIAAGYKQLHPINTFSLSVDETQPNLVTFHLSDFLSHTRLSDRLPWVDHYSVQTCYPAQSSFTCVRHELQRTLSVLYEIGFGERLPEREGVEMGRPLERRWSSAALLRGRDGKKERTLTAAPRIGSESEGEDKPFFKRSSNISDIVAAEQSSAVETANTAHDTVTDVRKEDETEDKSSV